MNLVLIGYRGTGKSTVAGLLGERLQRDVVHLDAEIVRVAGASIPDIVATHGWTQFRELEAQVTARTAERDDLVIDCGGGVILRADNVENLRRNGSLFWLRASVPEIVRRIAGGSDRPALKEGKTFTDEVEEVLAERTPLYAAAAHHRIETDARSLGAIADEILLHFDRDRRARDGVA